jgi:hypothetical protein
VGSRKFGGVLFVAFSNDHAPRHIHGFAAEAEVIVNLGMDGSVAIAKRNDAIRPANAKRSIVKRILAVAALHFEELAALWEGIHGKT